MAVVIAFCDHAVALIAWRNHQQIALRYGLVMRASECADDLARRADPALVSLDSVRVGFADLEIGCLAVVAIHEVDRRADLAG